jgi:hypothetical protein
MERIMNAYCPTCETELDQSTGICPACRMDPAIAAQLQPAPPVESELSLTERYRGTRFDISNVEVAAQRSSVSRGRSFVLVSLAAGAALYGLVMAGMGPF